MTQRFSLLRTILFAATTMLQFGAVCGTAVSGSGLEGAISPYLRMHADDAIEWHAWNAEALGWAEQEQKLIFLSIGYASCHWCHVQARTTFADPRVISLLNDHYVSILVDREERPDLDHHFAAVMSAMTGQSGWPANFILTPDLTPLFAAGYIAPEPEYGSPGLLAMAGTLASRWTTDRDLFLKDAEEISAELRALFDTVTTDPVQEQSDPRRTALRAWSASIDPDYGGFGRGQKFLHPNVLSFLLGEAVRRRDDDLLSEIFTTLDQMAAGGIRDHLGGAFHRYTVDRYWQVPHFEIMLNENALMAVLYLEAFQVSGRPRYAAVARGILEDLLARFRLPDGGFATALDADSEGVEGRYYTWTESEVRSVLGDAVAEQFQRDYLNLETGLVKTRAVLRLQNDPASFLEFQTRHAQSLDRLRKARAKRPAPMRDSKVLTSWTAQTVSAFARAAQVLDDDQYYQVARKEAAFLLTNIRANGRLAHSRHGTTLSDQVFLDDYAFLVQALIDLYETDFQIRHLDEARRLMEETFRLFQAEKGAPFQFTPTDQVADIPVRVILEELGVPSGNAIALTALFRLKLFSGDAAFADRTEALAQGLGKYLGANAVSATGLLRAHAYRSEEAREIVIVGSLNNHATQKLLREVYKRFLPGVVLAHIPKDAPMDNADWPLLAGRPLLDRNPTAYVCRNRLCDLPVDTAEALAEQLDAINDEAVR